MTAHGCAERAHAAMLRAKDLIWALRGPIKSADPGLWRGLCEAVAEATDQAGKAMDLTAGRGSAPRPADEEEAREMVSEAQWVDR